MKQSDKAHFSLEEKIDVMQGNTSINHPTVLKLAEEFDCFTFEQLKALQKCLSIFATGTAR